MRGLVLLVMVLLMALWTGAVVADLWYLISAEGATLAQQSGEFTLPEFERLFAELRPGFWSDAAQARAIVWGMPMMVFATIVAISRPARATK